MTNNQERILEIERKIKEYFTERHRNYELLTYQVDFLDGLSSEWERSNSQEEKLALIKGILGKKSIIEHTGFPPYCPTKLQGLLQEWLIIQLEFQFQAQIQQN